MMKEYLFMALVAFIVLLICTKIVAIKNLVFGVHNMIGKTL
jgi:hypothetical protein